MVAKVVFRLVVAILGLVMSVQALAVDLTPAARVQIQDLLPGSVQPGVLNKIMAAPPQMRPKSLAPITQKKEQQGTLGPQAEKIKFKLMKIILEGNHVYSEQDLLPLYKDKLNTTITVAELQDIVQDITNYYRNNGYILSRAILPPQHIQKGIVHVRVIEGYIDQVKIVGFPKGAKKMLALYGEQVSQTRPLRLKVMEHFLRLANEIPGMQVKAVLEPSKTNTGASTLNLAANESTFTGYVSYDNYGTLYIGPNEGTGNIAANSIFRSGDTTRFTYSTTSRPQQLKFYDAAYQALFGANGLTATVGKNRSATLPGLILQPLNINGASSTYYGLLQYPLVRSRVQNLTVDGGFNYIDSSVTILRQPLYDDHIRTIKAGGNYDFSDRFRGSNLIGLHVEQGLPILGASTNPNSTDVSRFGATGKFTKGVLQLIHVQPLFSRYSAFFLMNGQYSFNPLLSSEQYGYGGSQLGRGYDPAEIIGDKGMGGSVELRMDMVPGWYLLQTVQAYLFYDAGIIWNIQNLPGVQSEQSATSTGIGFRFALMNHVSGNVMLSQPLTKQIAAEQVVGNGRRPRGQFSIVASL